MPKFVPVAETWQGQVCFRSREWQGEWQGAPTTHVVVVVPLVLSQRRRLSYKTNLDHPNHPGFSNRKPLNVSLLQNWSFGGAIDSYCAPGKIFKKHI